MITYFALYWINFQPLMLVILSDLSEIMHKNNKEMVVPPPICQHSPFDQPHFITMSYRNLGNTGSLNYLL
jgi:hypothetical protein